jgi:hypothetical protein
MHVGDDVEHRRAVGIARAQGVAADHAGRHAQQHEAHLADGGVGQHALEVGLRDGSQVADDQRRHRQHHHHLLPVDRQAQHALDQQAHRDGKGRQLGRPPISSVTAVGAPW